MADDACRARIVDTLRRYGYTTVEHPTGFHVISAIADLIDDNARATVADQTPMPALLVIDAIARGCAGTTIAAGLRELGARIPLLLVRRPGCDVPASDDQLVHVVSADSVVRALIDLVPTLARAARSRGSVAAVR